MNADIYKLKFVSFRKDTEALIYLQKSKISSLNWTYWKKILSTTFLAVFVWSVVLLGHAAYYHFNGYGFNVPPEQTAWPLFFTLDSFLVIGTIMYPWYIIFDIHNHICFNIERAKEFLVDLFNLKRKIKYYGEFLPEDIELRKSNIEWASEAIERAYRNIRNGSFDISEIEKAHKYAEDLLAKDGDYKLLKARIDLSNLDEKNDFQEFDQKLEGLDKKEKNCED